MMCFILVLLSSGGSSFSGPVDAQSPITSGTPLEIASGGGQRGAWRQNESNYDYVDGPTVAFDSQGNAVVAWADQRQKDIFLQVYNRDGKPRHKNHVNVSRSPKIFSWLPRVALSSAQPSDLYILCQEIVFSGGSHGGEIFFARSRDGGANFSEPLNFSNRSTVTERGGLTKRTGTTVASTWRSFPLVQFTPRGRNTTGYSGSADRLIVVSQNRCVWLAEVRPNQRMVRPLRLDPTIQSTSPGPLAPILKNTGSLHKHRPG
jgi:hypothetical protein